MDAAEAIIWLRSVHLVRWVEMSRFALVAALAILWFSNVVVADPIRFFFVVSADNNGLYQVSNYESISERLIGTIEFGSDLFELVDVGDELVTLDRASNSVLVIDKLDASIVSNVPLDASVFITRRGLDASPSGTLYGLFDGMQLRTMDPVTGSTSFVAAITGAARVEAIAFSEDGTLYAAGSVGDDSDSENIYTLDMKTGALSLVGPTGFDDVDTLTFGSDGHLYGIDAISGQDGRLLRISLKDGSAVDLGETGVDAGNGISFVELDFIVGDVNADGIVSLLDIEPFISTAGGQYIAAADINQDGTINLLDIAPFVDVLLCDQ